MSDTIVQTFDFDLKPDCPDWVVSSFEALARGENLDAREIQAKEENYGLGFLTDFSWILEKDDFAGSPIILTRYQETGHESPFHAKSPKHHLSLKLKMHDDGFANGGYTFAYQLFDLVHGHGWFCHEFTSHRDRSTFYAKEFENLVILGLEMPSMAGPLPDPIPPGYSASDFAKGWKPSQLEDHQFVQFEKIGPEQRKREIETWEPPL